MDPLQVCALHRRHDCDLILLDLQMPVMDGFQVMAVLSAGDSYLPVIVLTAQPGHKLQALQAGAKDFISKPFDLLEVYAMLPPILLERLRVWWRVGHAQGKILRNGWLFPGLDPMDPLSTRQLNRAIHAAADAAKIDKRVSMHTLRHRFAVETLMGWYRSGEDAERRLPVLSTYLGHVHVSDTYWYLSAHPQLMALAMARVERRWEDRS